MSGYEMNRTLIGRGPRIQSAAAERQEERDRERYDAMVDDRSPEFDAALADVFDDALWSAIGPNPRPKFDHRVLRHLLDGRMLFPDRDEYVKAGVRLDCWKSFETWREIECPVPQDRMDVS